MTPTETFNNYQELYDYIYEFIITNHNNEIIAVQHNNIESGLLDFVTQSPRNSFKATVISSVGSYTATINQCVLVFKPTATGTIQLTDNRWNEWVIDNQTIATKQLIGSIANYITPNGIVRNYVPATSVIKLVKGLDNKWYETSTSIASSSALSNVPQRIQFIVGDNTSYEGSVNQSLIEIPVDGDTQMVINMPCVEDSVAVILAGFGELPRTVTDRGNSYGVVYNSGNALINLYPQFTNGELYIVRFDTTIAAVNYGILWTYFEATVETYITDEMPELAGAVIQFVQKGITPLIPSDYSFDPVTLKITLIYFPLAPDEVLFVNYLKPTVTT